MHTIDMAIATAFMTGTDTTIKDTRVACGPYEWTVFYHSIPIVVWDSGNFCLCFSLNGHNTITVKKRINGIMTYLHQKLILPRSWVIRTKRGMLQLVESNVFTYTLTDVDIVTINNVANLARPNNRAMLINIGPNTLANVNKCETQTPQSQKQKAAFLTFDDLSGVC